MSERVVNDFSIRIATPNGTGSTSANDIIFRSLFHKGLASSAKNLFPSNIAGLPTWYQIRVSPKGYQARKERWEILLPLNPATLGDDLDATQPGQVVVYNSDQKLSPERADQFITYGVPLDTLARKNLKDAKLRPKLRNMIYVGVLSALFGIDEDSIMAAIRSVFRSKQKVIDINWEALNLGIQYVRENIEKRDPYYFEKADQTADKVFLEGNQGAALGALYGGCTVASWYPITPASSLTESLIGYFERARVNEDGTRRYVVVQAEDELSAVGMALGAGWAGARAMTGTSGPGLSLMAENLGLGYYAEIPVVVYDIQRVGPSTGMPTRTQQSDILQAAFLSHGDTRFPMLFPSSPSEAFEFSWRAFDIAERLQTPIIYMSDLDLGMNTWIDKPLEYPSEPFDRGKVLTEEKLAELKDWGRYLDLDGDRIPYRSIAGRVDAPRAAYFTRGSGHDEYARYSEDEEVYERNLDRLQEKIDSSPKYLPPPVRMGNPSANYGLIAYGSSDAPIQEVLAEDIGEDYEYLRVRSWPFHAEVGEFLEAHERVLVIEQNQQGQLALLLRMAFPQSAGKIESANYYGGLPLSPGFVRARLEPFFGKVSV